MLWGELTTDREDGYPRKYYELTIGTIHNARQKEARKRGRKKEKRRLWKGEKRRLSKLSYATTLRS